MGREEGTSKHSSSQAHVGQRELPPKSWLEGTQKVQGKGEFNPAHSNMSPTQTGRLGQAKSQLLQLSSRQMARTFLEFPAMWVCRPSEIHRSAGGSSGRYLGRVAGVQGARTHRERERGQRGPLQGGEAGGTLMLLSTVGYLQGEKASTVVTPCGSLEHT